MSPLTPSPKPLAQGRLRSRRQGGFTLVELLASSAVAGLILVVLLGLLNGSLRIFRDGSSNLKTYGNARYALTRTVDDISSAVILNGSALSTDPAQPAPKPSEVALVQNHPALGDTPGVIFIQSRANRGAGDLVVTAYRHDPEQRTFERAEIDSNDVWNNGRDFALASIGPDDLDWRILCSGVTAFKLSFLTADDLAAARQTPTHPDWDSRVHGRPAQARIEFQVIDQASLELLDEVGADSGAGQRLLTEKTSSLSRNVGF